MSDHLSLSDCRHCDGTGYEPNGATDPRDPEWAEECSACEGTGDLYMRRYPFVGADEIQHTLRGRND